jgi:hypothetical protein
LKQAQYVSLTSVCWTPRVGGVLPGMMLLGRRYAKGRAATGNGDLSTGSGAATRLSLASTAGGARRGDPERREILVVVRVTGLVGGTIGASCRWHDGRVRPHTPAGQPSGVGGPIEKVSVHAGHGGGGGSGSKGESSWESDPMRFYDRGGTA